LQPIKTRLIDILGWLLYLIGFTSVIIFLKLLLELFKEILMKSLVLFFSFCFFSFYTTAKEHRDTLPAKYPQALSFTLLGFIWTKGTIGFEQFVRKNQSIELRFTTSTKRFSILGKGQAITLGYKFIILPPKKVNRHLLEGLYFRPEITYYAGKRKYTVAMYDYSNSSNNIEWRSIKCTTYSIAFGKQAIFGTKKLNFLVNTFIGLGYEKSKSDLTVKNELNIPYKKFLENSSQTSGLAIRFGAYVGLARR
jgi:hypothetical protein